MNSVPTVWRCSDNLYSMALVCLLSLLVVVLPPEDCTASVTLQHAAAKQIGKSDYHWMLPGYSSWEQCTVLGSKTRPSRACSVAISGYCSKTSTSRGCICNNPGPWRFIFLQPQQRVQQSSGDCRWVKMTLAQGGVTPIDSIVTPATAHGQPVIKEGVKSLRILPYTSVDVCWVNSQQSKFSAVYG